MTSPSLPITASSYLDIQGALGITKHNGGLSATLEILRLCRVAEAKEVLYVGSGIGVGPCVIAGRSRAHVVALDISERMLDWTRQRAQEEGLGDRIETRQGDVLSLPFESDHFEAVLVESVLAFVQDKARAIRECVRVTRPGGRVAAYVWDYAGGMQMIRHFWDVALELNRDDAQLDQAERFPLCQPGPLEQLFRRVGLVSVSVRAIDVPTVFRDFEDYWRPFLGKQGAAPTYLATLRDDTRDRIRDTLKTRLVPSADGSIAMTARAWAVQGSVTPNPSMHRTRSDGLRPLV